MFMLISGTLLGRIATILICKVWVWVTKLGPAETRTNLTKAKGEYFDQ